MGYSPWSRKESDTTYARKIHQRQRQLKSGRKKDAALKMCVQSKHAELTHVQELPLEDPSLNLNIPRPCALFCLCNSVFLLPKF